MYCKLTILQYAIDLRYHISENQYTYKIYGANYSYNILVKQVF